MTRDQIIERVKLLMHVGDRSDLSPPDEALLGDIATAIVDMLGPKELEWVEAVDAWISGGYEIAMYDYVQMFRLWMCDCDGVMKKGLELGTYPTLEAAKAAAQAHHEEQHWKRTRIWEDE